MKRKKNVNLDDKLIERAETKASSMGFTFSAYITYLINKDLTGESNIVPPKNNKVSNAISNILD